MGATPTVTLRREAIRNVLADKARCVMTAPQRERSGVRRAEIIAALSLATDLTMGQPLEFALRSCALGMRLGRVLGLSELDLGEVYVHSLLRYIGCNAESYAVAALFGDDVGMRRDFALIDPGNIAELASFVLRHLRDASSGAGALTAAWTIANGLVTAAKVSSGTLSAHCEVAQRLAERLGLGDGVRRNLGQLYERWDGKGQPNGIRGEAITLPVRVVTLVQDVVVLRNAHGDETAFAKLNARSGAAYDPRIVDRFLKHAQELLTGLDDLSSWDEVLALEPKPHAILTEEQFDSACLAMADFADIKSPYTFGHSRAVGELSAAAALRCGLTEADAADLRHAGMLHDIGQVALSGQIWNKAGPLTDGEREQVRLHPYYAERVLARPAALARLAAIICQHHERLDGSGYHRAARAQGLTPHGRILAVAEAYQSMREPRAHRAVLTPEAAAEVLKREVRAGRLDPDAVAAVLAAAGHRVPAVRRDLVAGLTGRELDVLRLIARGRSTKEIGRDLGVSPKTVDNHTQHLYAKLGVKTRSGAALFAIEHGLVTPPETQK